MSQFQQTATATRSTSETKCGRRCAHSDVVSAVFPVLVLALSDAGSSVVSYRHEVVDPRKPLNLLASKSGNTTTGTANATLRVRPAKSTRILRLKVNASDAVGNEATLAKTVRLG